MKYCILIFFIVISNLTNAICQKIIQGKVTDETGEPLTGATIIQKDKITNGTTTDFDGNYMLKIRDSEIQVTIQVSFISYETIEETINLRTENVVTKNFLLVPANVDLEEVVVKGKADQSRNNVLKSIQIRTPGTFDFITKETISKTGDSQVDDAVKRVTGVSTVKGFITVRGLADRYIKTTINGSQIPTLDPFTNNIKLDLFPTSLIDNIIIRKTQSPDLPADWSGAYLSIKTRDYPGQFMVNIKSSFEYNSQTTFRNVVSSERGPTDWLGYDNGYRNNAGNYTKESFPFINNGSFSENRNTLYAYDELGALGLRDYYASLGINESHLGEYINLHSFDDNIYYRLGLVELGFLAPAYIYNEDEIYNATERYISSGLKYEAYASENSNLTEFSKSMPRNWITTSRKAPVNFSQDISIGDQVNLWNRPLGLLAGLRYSSSVISTRWPDLVELDEIYTGEPITYIDRQETFETNKWSALISTSYSPAPNHSISLLFMPNFSGESRSRYNRYNFTPNNSVYSIEGNYFAKKYEQKYEERKQIIYQFESNHYFPQHKIKLDFNASFTNGESNIPGYKDIKFYAKDSIGSIYSINKTESKNTKNEIIYRYLYDDIFESGITCEFHVLEKSGYNRKFMFGGAYHVNKRKTETFIYRLFTNEYFTTVESPESYFLPENFEAHDGMIPLYYQLTASNDNFTVGERRISSGFVMTDFTVIPNIIIMGGIRVEYSDMFSDLAEYHELGYPKGDPRRVIPAGAGPAGRLGDSIADPSVIIETNFLPSVNFLYRIIENEKLTLNLRLNYGKSLARPSIREVSPIWSKDIELDAYVIGNPYLKITTIYNYDIRLEGFFRGGEYFTLSGFHKKFVDPIQIVYDGSYKWVNADDSKLFGLEAEGKKQIFKGFCFGANATYVYARTRYTFITRSIIEYSETKEHPMFGQAPYIINLLLDYTLEKQKLTVALSYNVQGPKFTAFTYSPTPPIYEMSRKMLDFKIAKTFANNIEVELKIRNILNAPVQWRYDGTPVWTARNNESRKLRSIWKDAFGLNVVDYPFEWGNYERNIYYGTNFTLSVSYKF